MSVHRNGRPCGDRASVGADCKDGTLKVKHARILPIVIALLATHTFVASIEAQISGRIRRVGLFPGGAAIVRDGHYTFAEVELRNDGSEPFDGELRLDQLDRDGDVVTSILQVALTPDGQWRPYHVYFTPHNMNQKNVRVRLFNAKGAFVKLYADGAGETTELVSSAVYAISDPMEAAGQFLIVDLTNPRRLPHAAWLDSSRDQDSGQVNFRVVRNMPPEDLPFRWQGLESVDAIVWDDADPSSLAPGQVEALIEWVKEGGRLLITAGQNWQRLSKSALADILPVQITGADAAHEAPAFLDALRINREAWAARLAAHYQEHGLTRCELRRKPGAIPVPARRQSDHLIYRQMLGRGVVTFVGASLRELMPPASVGLPDDVKPTTGEAVERHRFIDQVCEPILATTCLALPPVRERDEGNFGTPMGGSYDLFNTIRRSVGFEAAAAGFLVFGVLFAIIYTILATGGSYWFLKRKGWQHHAWTAFALVSIVGSVIGTGMVWTLRGFANQLHQTSVVDAHAGGELAYANCLFGVRSPDHTRLNLTLPVGAARKNVPQPSGPIRAVPEPPTWDADSSQYLAPEKYFCKLGSTRLDDTPIRATLKEFQGYWYGPMGGVLDGRLVSRRTGSEAVPFEFGQGSFIRNSLGVSLKNCYLLETREDVAAEAFQVIVHELGEIPGSGSRNELDANAIQQRLYFKDRLNPTQRIAKLTRLNDMTDGWCRSLTASIPQLNAGGVSSAQSREMASRHTDTALLLLSVFDLLDTEQSSAARFNRSYGRSLGCLHQLTSNTAILIGFVEDETPPPCLEVNYTNLRPVHSRTMYRFIIPVERPEGGV